MSRTLAFPGRTVHWWLLGTTALALALLPRNAAALTALLCACGWVVALVAVRVREPGGPLLALGRTTLVLGAPVVWLVLGSALAVNSRASFMGSIGQRTGSLTWVVAFLVFLSASALSRRSDVGRVMRAIAVAGALFGGAAVIDGLAGTGPARFSSLPAGLMENPISLAQVLVIAVACGLGWAASTRSVGGRVVAGVSVVGSLAGLAAAGSAGAWVGVSIGLLVGGLALAFAKRGRLRPDVAARALTALVIVGVLAVIAMLSAAAPDPALSERLNTASHDRVTLWDSALAQIEQAPLVGSGPEQYSAWVRWDIDVEGRITYTAAYDPHSLPLWWLLSGGLAGLALALFAAVTLLGRQFAMLAASRSPAVAGVIAATVGWVASATFAWSGTLALALCALLAGTLDATAVRHGAATSRSGDPRRLNAAALGAAGLAVLALSLVLAGGGVQEYGWARAVDNGTAGARLASAKAASDGDPAYVAMVVADAAQRRAGGSETLSAPLRAAMERDSSWHADVALARFFYEYAGAADAVGWEPVADAVEAGRRADPTSGLWDSVAALQASRGGFEAEASEYAARALEHRIPLGVAARLSGLLSTAGAP